MLDKTNNYIQQDKKKYWCEKKEKKKKEIMIKWTNQIKYRLRSNVAWFDGHWERERVGHVFRAKGHQTESLHWNEL